MKKLYFTLHLLFTITFLFAQDKEDEVKSLILKGIEKHDKGNYVEAIKEYDAALKLIPNHKIALSEKAMSLVASQKYDEGIKISKKLIKDKEVDPMVYVVYGNALDQKGKPKDALKIYDEGIKKFPNYFMLTFNKAITLINLKKTNEAILSAKQSLISKNTYPSTHNLIGRISLMNNENIKASLALMYCIVLEPLSTRSKENLKNVKIALNLNVKKDKNNTINLTIPIDPKQMEKKGVEDDFSILELTVPLLMAGLESDEVKEKLNLKGVQKLKHQLEAFFNILQKEIEEKKHKGFFWEYYVPYFIEMKEKDLTQTFVYLLLATEKNNEEVQKWLNDDGSEIKIKEFYDWSKSFKWTPIKVK